MDAKSKASFINSIAAGQIIPCPNCNTANKPDSRYCIACGTRLVKPSAAPVETAPVPSPPPEFHTPIFETAEADAGVSSAFAPADTADEPIYTPDASDIAFTPAAENTSPFAPAQENSAPAFTPAAENTSPFTPAQESAAPAFAPAPAAEKPVETEDETSAFANGLPSWDIVPPQIMVRRR